MSSLFLLRAGLAVGVLYWLPMLAVLAATWSTNEQYTYGWAVPFLALGLAWLRWPDRPEIFPREIPAPRFLWGVAITAYAAMRWLQKANPDWRLLHWALWALLSVAILLVLRRVGGAPWVRHFFFPVFFLALAVPWPMQLEQVVIRGMTEVVAEFAVAALNLINVPAVKLGNVIETLRGLVGVNEACSGVRSFQSSLMFALVIGELGRKRLWQRVVLVLSGAILAFAGNLMRTLILGWLAAEKGLDQAEAAHDPAGLGVLALTLGGLWLIARMLTAPRVPEPESFVVSTALPAAPWPRPVRTLGLLVVAWLCIEISAEVWFRWNERALQSTPGWTVTGPRAQQAGLRLFTLPQRVVQTIGSDLHVSARGKMGDRAEVWVYYFRFEPRRNAAEMANIHRPEVCLPSSGGVLKQDHDFRNLNFPGGPVPFHVLEFQSRGRTLYTLHCVWPDRRTAGEKKVGLPDWTTQRRILDAIAGKRTVGQRVLQMVVVGVDNAEQACTQAQALIHQMVEPVN